VGKRRSKRVKTPGGSDLELARELLKGLALTLDPYAADVIHEDIIPLMIRRQSGRRARNRWPDPTKEQVMQVKVLLATTTMAQQKIANMIGLGTAGRVSEILWGEWDKLLEDDNV
jgi:hypothetical protein